MSFVKHDLFHSEAMLTLIAVENVVRLLKKKTDYRIVQQLFL